VAGRHSARFVALVDAARGRITETTPEAVRDRLAADEGLVLVDVREESEWARGRLPGAVHVGKGVIERDAEAAFPDLGAPLVLYCGGGYRSALAADALRQMGYARVESMDGGFRAWTAAGYPVEE
jgi:rhodanese-related sulfurtransferase